MINFYKKNITSIFLSLSYLTDRWNIGKKIIYGYTITISIAAIGTVSGLVIADYYEKSAQNLLLLSYHQQSLLKDLQNAVIVARLHPQKLVSVLDNSIWFEFEKNKFRNDIIYVNQQLSGLETFIKKHPQDLAVNQQYFTKLLHNYQNNTNFYNQTILSFWDKVELDHVLEKSNNSYLLLNLLQKQEYLNLNVKFEQLSDDLIIIVRRAEIQKEQANFNFSQAKKLRIQIILGSILLSSIIASAIAFFTTKLITSPLQIVTNTAKEITQESNFQLRANVNSHDEVGTLATSLNCLVEWVEDYTRKLEFARATLEIRVEERTQQLEFARATLEIRVEERTQQLQQVLQDLKDTQAQLIQTEKMSSLGEMVAGIAHEINNPVNFIHGNIKCTEDYLQDLVDLLNLYQQEYPHKNFIIEDKIAEIDLEFLLEDLSKIFSSMKVGTQRIREIVLSLRNFSRLDESEIKDVDIHQGIENTLLILNYRLKPEIKVIRNYADLPLIDCYPAQLNQVFMNIINNAIDALIECKEEANKEIVIETSKINDRYIKVGIRDNGIGISPEIINKLFDPFFTTKPPGKGTGLGLSICYQIIEKHQGKIEVISVVGKGVEFVITLPMKHEAITGVKT